MTEESKKKIEAMIDEMIASFKQMREVGYLPDDTYHKMLISAAYEYSQLGQHLRAASIAQGIPLDYYQKVQRGQMEEDANYAHVAYTLALNLLQNGYIQIGQAVSATQPAARA